VSRRARRPSWAILIGAFSEPIEWSLDRAASFARHYPDEVATIERLRAYMRARVASKQLPIELDDLVFAFTLVMGALDFELSHLGAFGASVETETISLPRAA
jgi:hypothetical protein